MASTRCLLASLCLIGCNAVLGIERHDFTQVQSGGGGGVSNVASGATSATAGHTAAAGRSSAGEDGASGPSASGGTDASGGATAAGASAEAGAAGGPDSDPPEYAGVIAFWDFDAMSGDQIVSSLGLPLPLTVQGATLSEGPRGNCLLMSNSQGSAVASAPVIDTSGSFSISVWVRLDALDAWNTFVSQDGRAISSFYLQKRDTNEFAFTTFPSDSTLAMPCIAKAALQPRIGEWYHLAATRDGATAEQRIYVNGVLSGEASCAGGFKTTGPLTVGRGQWAAEAADWMSGAIDDLGVSDRVLAPSEIIDLHRVGRPSARRYLLAHFQEKNEGRGDGLRFAHSHDALQWSAVGIDRIFLPPTVGGKSFRDPHVMRDPLGTYHVVWTTSCVPWAEPNCVQDTGFAHASSQDLVTFSDPSYVEIPRTKLNVEHVWAPEVFYDSASAQYLVFWSGAVDVSTGADPHSIYYMLTEDFVSFSDPAVLYARPDRNFIDATIVTQADRYLMFLKDEAEGQKNIRVVSSPSLFGISAWSDEVSPPLTGAYAAEGPIVLPQGGNLLLLFDRYGEGTYGALRSRSLDNLEDPSAWEDVSASILAAGLRHGSAIEVPPEVFRAVAIAAAE